MKANRHLIILLLAMMAMLSGRCYATDYDLWIAGVQVTSSNASHITGEGITGSVIYQPSTNILYLNNANINVTEPQVDGIKNGISGLIIRLTGNNFIDANTGVEVDANTTIDGSGTLTINSYFTSILAQDDLTITNCLVDVCSSRNQGIVGNINHSSLTIDGGSLIALGGGGDYPYPIYGFRQFILQNGVTLPSNMHWNNHGQDGRLEYDNGTPVTGRVYIEAVSHQLWVAGQRLGGGYSGTGTYTFTGEGITGSVAYNFSTNTLTLSGATITASLPDDAITNHIPNLKIQVVGDNHITTDDLGIYSTTDMTFQGSGELYINTDWQPIRTCGNITINNCYISLRNNQSPSYYNSYGIAGVSSSEQILTINGGSLIATGGYPNGYPIGGFKHLVMAGGSNITFPSDSHYDEQSQRVEFDDGTPVANMVVIEPVNHQLWVAGEQLSGSSGTYTFSNSCITNGSVTYNFSTNTLTLSGASITASGTDNGIKNYIPDLKILLTGSNSISTYSSDGIYSQADMTIQGIGTLNVTASSKAICAEGNLTFNSCTVEARSYGNYSYGIYGTSGKTLAVNGGSLTARGGGTTGYPVFGFGHLSMTGVNITYPAKVHYHEGSRCLEYADGSAVTGKAIIEQVDHNLWVAGYKLTGNSGTHTFTGPGITGSVAYNFSTNTLTLSGASITAFGTDDGIKNYIPNLKIQLAGTNSISTYSSDGIYSQADMTIQGTGTLNVTSTDYTAIYAEGNLTLSNCTVVARSNNEDGIYGTSGKTLAVNGGSLTARGGGTNGYPIKGFGHLTMGLRVYITYPVNVHYDEDSRRLEYANGSAFTGEVDIEQVDHNLWVAGNMLERNIETYTFTGSGITGSATYNYSTNTLTLNNATIAASGNTKGIENSIPNLKIQLIGDNSISTYNGEGIHSDEDMTLQGTGKLTIYSENSHAINTSGNLSIKNCTVEAKSTNTNSEQGMGILGSSGKNLTITGSTVTTISGSNSYPIKGFDHLYMSGVSITYPGNAYYSSNERLIKYNQGFAIMGKAVIEAVNHQLFLAGHQLEGNSGTYNFNGFGTQFGLDATYNFSTNTLNLFYAHITATGDTCGIENHIPGLKINVSGSCNITAESSGIYSDVDMTIQKASNSWISELNVTSENHVISTKGNLTINGCDVVATNVDQSWFPYASYHGVYGSSNKTLAINSGSLTAKGNILGYPIYDFGHLSMSNGVTISQPANAHYDETDRQLEYTNGILVSGTAVIEFAHYDLWVDGTQATSGNANDILGDGKVSYDAVTNILTLNNVNINSGNLEGIRNGIAGLTINTVGECRIESEYETALVTTENLNISGTGKLYLIGRKNGIRTNGNLVLQNGSDVVARSNGVGDFAAVYGDANKTLTVNHSSLYARSDYSNVGTIYGFQNVNIIESRIDEPRYPITWNTANHRYEDEEGERVKGIIYIDYHAYNLFVKGTQVTSANADDVFGDGTVSYDPTSNTLTLNEANITSSNAHAIKNQIYGLKIALVGDNNRITANGYSGIYSSQDFFIQGRGKLVVTGSCGIYANDCDLTVRGGCKLYPTSNGGNNYGGIQGAAQHTLSVSECVVTASTFSTTKSPISGFDSLVLDEMEITTPSGGTYHDGNVYDGNAIYYGRYNNQNRAVNISPAPYELWVKNIQVTAANASDILNDGGSISYDAIDNVLTLNGATITGEGAMCINNKIPGLVISLVGNNTVTSNLSGIYSLYDCTIEGRGTLDVTGKCGILTNGNLTLRGGCNLTVHGTGTGTGDTETGIYGSSNKTITIDGCYVSVSSASTQNTAIDGFGTLALNEMTMTTPANGSFSGGVVRDNGGNPYYGQVVFSPIPYNLWVAGAQVTSANAFDVLNDGTISYDAEENVLTLNGANLNVFGSKAIENKIPDLKISLVGENTVISNGQGIYSEESFSIEGRGSLDVTGNYGIFVYGNLEISGGCDLTATGTGVMTDYCAIGGSGALYIERSKVTATTNSTINSAIAGFTSMTLDCVTMTCPTNCTYSNRAIRYNSNNQIYTGQVVIEPDAYDIWIGGQQITSANALDVLGDGKVSYEWEEHELHLHEATLRYSEQGEPVIYTTYGNLNIYLFGENYIIGNDSEGCDAIVVENYGDNYGDGNQLNFVGMDGGTLTTASDLLVKGNWTIYLSNTTVSIGDGGSIYAAGDAQENGFDISLYKSTLSAYSIFGMGYYGGNLIDGEIMQPEGAYIDLQEGAVMLSNQLATNVVIGCGYGLFVGHEEVTTLNANHITSDEISGNISFDPSTFTLTLENANIVSDNDGIHFTQPNASLEINLVGENTILSDGDGGIFSLRPVTIKGDGSLYTVGTDGIYCENDLSLEDSCTVEAIGTGLDGSGIACYGGYHRLSIDENVTLKAHTNAESSQATIQGFGQFVLNNVEVLQPFGGSYNTTSRRFEDAEGNLYNGYVEIGNQAYDLWVAGIQVTSANVSDVLNDGTVSYDAEGNVLALNGATITGGNSAGIASSIQDLVISLTGVNSITSNSYGIYSDADFAVEGAQSASLIVQGSVGFYLEACDLNIHGGCTVTAVGTDTNASAFYCHEGIGHTFTIVHSIVNANGEYAQSAISGFENLNLVEAGFVTPNTAVYSDGKIKNSGSVYHYNVVIGDKPYSLYVAGIHVTAFNANLISGENISGSVRYDAESNTLTLENAAIDGTLSSNYTFSSGIHSSIGDLKIKLIGSNDVEGVGATGYGIYTSNGMIIEGPGTLYVTGKYGIKTDSDLSIVGNCEMEITGTTMEAVSSSNKSFTIEDSYVTFSCPGSKYPINGCRKLIMNGTEVFSPAGAEWSESNRRLKINGNDVYEQAVIKPCNVFMATSDSYWDNPDNWSKGVLPLATSKVHIAAPCVMDDDVVVKEIVIDETGSMTLVNDAVLTVDNIDNDDATRFVIVKGQLECNTEVPGTFHIDIASALTDEAGWYAIAVPMSSSSLTNLTDNTYDIYAYDEDADQQEWQNYKVSPFSFVPGQGYLYANSAATDLIMTGTFIPLTATVTLPLSYGAQYEGIRGFNLIGNPYPSKLSMNEIKIDGEPITEFYRFVEGENGTEIVPCTSGDILPGEGFFIRATAPGQTLTMEGE